MNTVKFFIGFDFEFLRINGLQLWFIMTQTLTILYADNVYFDLQSIILYFSTTSSFNSKGIFGRW